jgi:pimeloyl-ACP methyl ester carboxylesterase
MPPLERPDGATLHWEEAGQGPTVLICNTFNLAPMGALVERLVSSRRVLTYDPRGVGRSSRGGPYDFETGVADLEALLDEAGPVATAFGIGDGGHRALLLADARSDLIDRVVVTSTALGRLGRAGFSGSTEVLEALMSLMGRDYRSGLRSMVAGSGAEESDERDRVEELAAAIPQEAAVGYLQAWIAQESLEAAHRLGPRLTIMGYEGNYWFPLSMYEEISLALPEAEFEVVDDGPINRPDLAAALVLRVGATG